MGVAGRLRHRDVDHDDAAAGAPKRHDGKPQQFRPSDFAFKKHGKSGIEVSEIFPQLATTIDDWTVIRSMKGDHGNHFEATLAMHCGSVTVPMPSLGAWVSHGLGTMNANLPSYVVFAKELPYAGSQVFDASFLPGVHQGVRVIPGRKLASNTCKPA